MYNRVYNHLDSKGLLYEKQFDFQRSNSTEHAILQLTTDITGSFEKMEHTHGVFRDLSKTFDIADHQILIKKIQYYRTDGTALKWFKSYLKPLRITEKAVHILPKCTRELSRYYLWCSPRICSRATSFPSLCR